MKRGSPMTIERINPGPRSSEMVVHNDTIYITTTPNKAV